MYFEVTENESPDSQCELASPPGDAISQNNDNYASTFDDTSVADNDQISLTLRNELPSEEKHNSTAILDTNANQLRNVSAQQGTQQIQISTSQPIQQIQQKQKQKQKQSLQQPRDDEPRFVDKALFHLLGQPYIAGNISIAISSSLFLASATFGLKMVGKLVAA